jgi:hypothetical protein
MRSYHWIGIDNYCPSLFQAEQPWMQDWMGDNVRLKSARRKSM